MHFCADELRALVAAAPFLSYALVYLTTCWRARRRGAK